MNYVEIVAFVFFGTLVVGSLVFLLRRFFPRPSSVYDPDGFGTYDLVWVPELRKYRKVLRQNPSVYQTVEEPTGDLEPTELYFLGRGPKFREGAVPFNQYLQWLEKRRQNKRASVVSIRASKGDPGVKAAQAKEAAQAQQREIKRRSSTGGGRRRGSTVSSIGRRSTVSSIGWG